jgi:hypothetical protein
MKKILFFINLLIITAIITVSCKKNSESPPCDGKGTICISNKRDSLIVIFIEQTHTTLNINHDEMQCQSFLGGATYTLKFSGPAYTADLKDTTFLVQNCDNKLINIRPPTKK